MHFLFGNDKKQNKKITNQMTTHIKNSLKAQFCQFCQKSLATKVAFVNGQKHGFTCNNCELVAVGNQIKNLGQKSLISNQKFSDLLTKSLISYETFRQQPNASYKESQNENKNILKQMSDLNQKIKMQMKRLKTTTHEKMDQICKESQKQNNIYVFEEVIKASKDKKASMDQIKNLVIKRSIATKRGLQFIDQETIEQNNILIQDRIGCVKKQTKLKLKQVQDLTQWINSIQIQ